MDLINSLIDTCNIPSLTAFLLGVLTSISPCPLATNITAIAYVSKEVNSPAKSMLNGLFYTLGRGLSYTLLAIAISLGISAFSVSGIFQGWGEKVLGPLLIFIGLFMLGVIRINGFKSKNRTEKTKEWLAKKGYLGSFLLGMLFALAFCPYSGVLFFGALMPLVLQSSEGLLLPAIFAFGTGLPVILFSFLIAFSAKKIGKFFNVMQKIEKVMRYSVGIVFLVAGTYYSQHLWAML